MWALLVLTVAVAAAASETADNQTAAEEKLVVARGKLLAPSVVGWGIKKMPELHHFLMERWALYHNLEYDSSEEKNPRLILYNEKDEVVKTVPVKKMKADDISSLLDSLGFYKRSQKGEEVPEEFHNFPLRAPRDEL